MSDSRLTELTADIVGNFVAQNTVSADTLPDLIRTVYTALHGIASGESTEPAAEVKPKPTTAQIKASIQPEHLVSFLTGQKFKSLRRHLTTRGYTFDQYREEFGLPKDYPTVSPNYSKTRSDLAVAAGLGQRGRARSSEAAEPVAQTARNSRTAKVT